MVNYGEAISRAYSHQAQTNGQPMNDKRGGASFMRKQEQIEGQVFSKMDEIRKQEERVERLEHQQHLKEMGLNRQGSGLEMSVQNIPRIREELEKAKRGESFFTKATLKRSQEELTRLEAISEQMGKTSIQPATQALIDEGLVNQWQKQPNTYFVKGLRRVALELTEEGEFQLSSQTKYHPKTDEERLKVDELLAKQAQGNTGVKQMIEEERSSVSPELFVAFDFTENPRTLHKLGWAEWSSRKVRGSVEVPDYQVGDRIETQVQIVGGETKPPKRLTESQLIGQIFPKYGLGTQATRGEIIKKIQSKGYVVKDKKTGQLTPTNKAYLLINYLYDNEFSDPETTGGWEMFLSQIGEGTINPREFVDAIKDKLTLQIKEVKERGD